MSILSNLFNIKMHDASMDLFMVLAMGLIVVHLFGAKKVVEKSAPRSQQSFREPVSHPATYESEPIAQPKATVAVVKHQMERNQPMVVVRHLLRLMGDAHARAHSSDEVESLTPQMLHWMEQNQLPLQGRRLAMGVWGIAKMLQNPQDMEHRPFLLKLTELILRSADLFTLHGLTNISRAYASMCRDTKDEELISMRLQILETMAARVPDCMEEAVEQPVVNLIWSFAVSDIALEDAPHSEQMLRCLADQLITWNMVEATLGPRYRLQRQLLQLEGHPIVAMLENL